MPEDQHFSVFLYVTHPTNGILIWYEWRLGYQDTGSCWIPTWNLEHLHPVQQCRGDGGRRVCSSNKKHLRQVKGHIHEMVCEAVVLLGIQDLRVQHVFTVSEFIIQVRHLLGGRVRCETGPTIPPAEQLRGLLASSCPVCPPHPGEILGYWHQLSSGRWWCVRACSPHTCVWGGKKNNKKIIFVTKMICKCLEMNTKELSSDESFTPSCTVVKLIYISSYVTCPAKLY